MATLVMSRNISPDFPHCVEQTPAVTPCSPVKTNILDCADQRLSDEQNQPFPGPLLSDKMNKEDLIRFIQRKSQQCLLHVNEPDQRESYFFWMIMELFCKNNGKVLMPQVAAVLFRGYGCLRKTEFRLKGVQKQDDWCLSLAELLCAALPKDEHIKAVIALGDEFASKEMTYAAHLCYVVAKKDSGFDLIGCKSLTFQMSAMKEATERTEVYEYVLSLTSGSALPKFQDSKILYAFDLFESGLSAQALDYCETIARAVTTFPEQISDTLLEELIRLSDQLHEGTGEVPEWLQNLHLLRIEYDEEEEEEDEEEVLCMTEDYSSRAQEHRAFSFLTEEITSQYTVGALLGKGGCGDVFEGTRKADNAEVAIKFFIRDDYQGTMTIPGDTRTLPIEVALMEMVSKPSRSPFVLELLEWFEIHEYTVLILERPQPCMDLLEYCEWQGGTLPEPLVRDIMRQLVQAASHCCDRGVFHNDIKPTNVLINTETLQIKLIDFGCGDLLQKTPYTYDPATPEYYPPEWYRHGKYMALPITIWTLGIVLYELLYGDWPFQTREEISNGSLHFASGPSKDCCELISWCLKKEPESRPNFSQILEHKWMTG